MEREVRVRHDAETLVLEVAEAVVEEVQVEDVLPRHAAVEQLLHLLEQERRLAGAARTDADRGLARDRRHVEPARDAGRQLGLAEVEDDVAQGIEHCTYGPYCCRKWNILATFIPTCMVDREACSLEPPAGTQTCRCGERC